MLPYRRSMPWWLQKAVHMFDAMVASKSSANETVKPCAAPMKRIKIQTEWIKRSNPIPHTPIRINYDELIWIVALSPSLSIILVTCTRHQFIQRRPSFPGFANRLGRSETPGFSGSIQIMGSLFNLNRFILYILQQRADLKHMAISYEFWWYLTILAPLYSQKAFVRTSVPQRFRSNFSPAWKKRSSAANLIS